MLFAKHASFPSWDLHLICDVSLLIKIDCVHLIKILSNRKMQRTANCIYLEASREREYEDWQSPPSYFY